MKWLNYTSLKNSIFTFFFLITLSQSSLYATSWVLDANATSTSASTSGSEYDNDQDISTTLTLAGASYIRVTVTGETESDYDFLYINENLKTKSYSGVLNSTYVIAGNSVNLRFTSDNSVTKSGPIVTLTSATSDDLTPVTTYYNYGILPFDLINPSDTQNIIGNTQIIGNTVECVTTTEYASSVNYSKNYSDLTCDNTIGNYNNNNYTVKYHDIDSNSSTFNSSSATIELPDTYKEIAWVGLFWQAHINNNSVIYRTRSGHSYNYTYSNDYPAGGIEDTTANNVLLKIGNDEYQTIQADTLNYFNSTSYARYSAFANITEYFTQTYSPSDTIKITVANILASVGIEDRLGNYGAWSLVVIYKEDEDHSLSKLRNNSVYLGYKAISSSHNDTITLNDFLLPKSGNIDSQMAVFAAEGEYRYRPDTMTLDGTALGDPDTSNVFDARLSDSITRNPSMTNNNGIDIDVFDTSTIMTAKRDADTTATSYSSTISLTSDADLYYPSMVSFTTELYKPRVCYFIDTIVDSGGTAIFEDKAFVGEINSGENYTFNVWISNMRESASDPFIEVANLVQVYLEMNDFGYVAESTKIQNVGETSPLDISDAITSSIDDIGEHNATSIISTWRVGIGADRDQGGTLTPNDSNPPKAYVSFDGFITTDENTTSINLLDYLTFKASFQTDTITIGVDNAQIITQCEELNASGVVGAFPAGVFNVIMTSNASAMSTYGSDPMPADLSPLNAIPTQISNKSMELTVVSLQNDASGDPTDFESFKGLVSLELIEQPAYQGDSGDQTLCENAIKLAPTTTNTFSFDRDTFVSGSLTYSNASKDTSFRVKYLTNGVDTSAVGWNCTNNTFNCLWGMLVRTYGNNDDTPCKSSCNPAGVVGNAAASEACISCVFGGAYAGSSCARDDFAIRPNKLTLSSVPTFLTSAKDYNISLTAEQYGNTNATLDYNVSNVQSDFFALDSNKTIYNPDGTDGTATLNGTLNFATPVISISDGASNAVGVNFDDVGTVNIYMIDKEWAKVDIDSGDTVADCSPSGAYICGDVNATFIPAHFKFSNESLNNHNGSTFTYLSNDLNMSAALNLTLTAENESNHTTLNFDSSSWENPVNVTFAVPVTNTMTATKKELTSTVNLGFVSGVKTISNNDANLSFNFPRLLSDAKNPFMVAGSDINVTATSTYDTTHIVTTTKVSDNNATFVYGRTNAPRQRFTGATGTALIYYESFCNGTDSTGVTCDKTLLPNQLNSAANDDPRWFINSSHVVAAGNAGSVNQKTFAIDAGSVKGATTGSYTTNDTPAKISLKYVDASTKGYPYKTTMENNASSWLIYNPFDASNLDHTNEFEVEFDTAGNSWAGKHETNTTTGANASSKTNRRTMW